MKILQIIHKPQPRGAEIFTCQLSNHLKENSHIVKIVSVFKNYADLPWSEPIESLNANANNRFLDYKAWQKLAIIINNFNPAVVQVNAGDTLKYAVFSKYIYNWPQPIVVRNASEVGRYLKSSFQKKINYFFYKKASKVISVSYASKKDLQKHFPFLKEKIEVIPVGLEESTPEPMVLKPNNKKHIVHIGGFTFEKNHRGLLRIFKQILTKEPDSILHLVGNGPLFLDVEKLTQNMNLENKVIFHGFVNNPLSYLKAADVLVLPSIIEGLPGVLLEAMYCRVPVVAYDVGGISEIVTENTGALIIKGNELSFANATIEAIRNPNQDQIESACQIVQEKFMNKDIALKFVNSYQKLVEQSQ